MLFFRMCYEIQARARHTLSCSATDNPASGTYLYSLSLTGSPVSHIQAGLHVLFYVVLGTTLGTLCMVGKHYQLSYIPEVFFF